LTFSTPADVEECAHLLAREKTTDREVAAFCTRFVARFFFNEPLPEAAIDAAMHNINQGTPTPVLYVQSARGASMLHSFVKGKVPDEHLEDVIHNMGAAASGLRPALLAIRDHSYEVHSAADVARVISPTPIVAAVPRVAKGNGTVGGLLASPLVRDQTLILLQIGSVAKETRDDMYMFGPGPSDRQCPFKPLLMRFAPEVAQRVQALRAAQAQ
jgi:hypothetical protein